ncbi:MAG TPA: CHASE2 domain-containing protein [Leptolyngbyaceae cyanobacterium]
MEYQIGGSLTVDAPSYIERQADKELYEALKKGQFCYVLNSRQMGKSSLLVRTKHRLQAEGFKCTAVDMTIIGSENVTPVQWYKGIVADLCSSLKLFKKINLKTWWQQHEEISFLQKLSLFIEELLVIHFPREKLFIFIDEIDSILSLDFSVDDFFAFIRFCYNQRAINPEYKRITFAIFGVATPSDLIKNKNRTPFNIGRAIELQGFTWQEALPLAAGIKVKEANGDVILKEILAWTGGQPFLTQKLCQLVTTASQTTLSGMLAIPRGTEEYWVESIVRSHIIDRWETQDEPEHLRTIRDRIQHHCKYTGRMLGIYQQILLGVSIETDDSPEQIELMLSGLVVKHQGLLKVKNPIYQEVFNFSWVERQLAALRPYSQTLEAWLASKQTNTSYLLEGQTLKDALTWALGKSLSDLDYQYLAASQELSKQETENALESLEQANYILSFSRRKVKKETLRYRISPSWTGIAALGVAVSVTFLRWTGILQGMEWNMLDWFFRFRPLEPPDSRVVVVTIDENDISKVRQWPIPDTILTQAIKNIKTRHPRAIGLDIYRDLPVEPGADLLVNMFRSTPNLIGIEKVVGSRVAPPPVLSQLKQIGFVDMVLDADGKIRRGLISVESNGEVHLSLALQLALIYLEAEGVSAKPISGNRWRFGKAVFEPLDGNDGGYVQANSGGYQILLNYRGLLESFPTISFADVVKNRIPPGLMENRIILIGTTAESLNDLFYTPYSSSVFRTPKRTPGVVVHANLISQIVSAVLDGRPLLKVWGETKEWLWILWWSFVGAALSWRLKSLVAIAVSILLVAIALLLITYLAFLYGWWLPVIPSLLTLVGAAIVLAILINKKIEELQLRRILEILLEECANSPTAARIAIEYLKQSESDRHQALLEKWLNNQNLP